MGDLTAHFSKYEFRCRDGSEHSIDCGLLAMLEAIRCHFDKPATITSGYRSPDYNAAVGGASNSQHLYGTAADFQVANETIDKVYDWCNEMFPVCGLGLYRRSSTFGWGWIHIDNRGSRARWTG